LTATPDFIHHFEPPTGDSGRTLLLLHGTGGNEQDMIPMGTALALGGGLLSPRGKVLEGGVATRFFRRHGEGDLDIEDLKERTDELAEFIRWASDEYDFDLSGLVALGFSNGANVAVALLYRHPELLAGAALLRPMLPYRPDPVPDLTGKPVLIDSGQADPLITPDQPAELAELLAGAGADVSLQITPGAGHGLAEEDLDVLMDWFNTPGGGRPRPGTDI
jgi:phospholipase/carboxylesterase